ncbi:MAG: DEAD/DEAH box helicase family protein [Dinghuibacter sp.]|nr:DEAD/DEAH box helicase family protein [Dinghuibacter sp.]
MRPTNCTCILPAKTVIQQHQYPEDYFDFIIIDECHRGGANDESNWRGILDYFSSAVQLGLTATPKRKDNIDTYKYFGEPVYIYSLKEGVNDGFLTPFKVKRIKTTLDDYRYTPDDTVVEGEIEAGKLYEEKDFNRTIEIVEREAKRVAIFALLNDKQKEFISFVLSKYVETGVDELEQEKLPILLTNKYQSLEEAKEILGDVANISKLFIEFQQHLYNQKVA